MNSKKITEKTISMMAKQSLKASRMRNTFVMITIVLASALLTAILMYAMGRNQQVRNELSHRQQAGYYNLTCQQMETLKKDDRIAYQIQVKTGILSQMDGFDVMPMKEAAKLGDFFVTVTGCDKVIDEEDFVEMMNQAIEIQPLTNE